MNDPSHKAMLYFLELLMNSDSPMTLTQLATRFFSSKSFTPDMREACGRTTEGLRKFLNRFPSLFNVDGNTISAVTIDLPTPTPRITNGQQHHDSLESLTIPNSQTISLPLAHDFGQETEAVKFFQRQLLKREERWVMIRSLAGHLSQASAEVRAVVGPQLDFHRFLFRHPHVFETQGELVSLRDTFFSSCLPRNKVRPPSTGSNSPAPSIKSRPTRPKSLYIPGVTFSDEVVPRGSSAPNSPTEDKPAPLSMSAKEYKAVLFLRQTVLVKLESSLPLATLFSELVNAADGMRTVVGSTMVELEEFLRKHSVFFKLSGSSTSSIFVSCRCDLRKINVIITNGKSGDHCPSRTLTNQRGSVFHVAKLWGIIDLGGHEHVFFDKSIFKHLDDLQKYFKAILHPALFTAPNTQKDEPIYFNAILAAKDSRAKWRATQVWKETDREIMEGLASSSFSGPPSRYHGDQQLDDEGLELCDDIQFVSEEIEAEMSALFLAARPPLPQPTAVVVRGNDGGGVYQQLPSNGVGRLVDVATQTLSTGEIMATKFFHEDDA